MVTPSSAMSDISTRIAELEREVQSLRQLVAQQEHQIQDPESKGTDTSAQKENLKTELEEGALIMKSVQMKGHMHSTGSARAVSPEPDVSSKPVFSSDPDVSSKPRVSFNPDASFKPDVSVKPDVSFKPALLTVNTNQPTVPKKTSLHQSIHAVGAPKPIDPLVALEELKKRAKKASIKLDLAVQEGKAMAELKDEKTSSSPSGESILVPNMKKFIIGESKRVDDVGRVGETLQVSDQPCLTSHDNTVASGHWTIVDRTTDTITAPVSPEYDKPSLDKNFMDTSDGTLNGSSEQLKDEKAIEIGDESLIEISQTIDSTKQKKGTPDKPALSLKHLEYASGKPPTKGTQALIFAPNPRGRRLVMRQGSSSDSVNTSFHPERHRILASRMAQYTRNIWIGYVLTRLETENGVFQFGHLTRPASEKADMLVKLGINSVGLPTISLVGRVYSKVRVRFTYPSRDCSIKFTLPTCFEPEGLHFGTVPDPKSVPDAFTDMLRQALLEPGDMLPMMRYVSFKYKDFKLTGFQEDELAVDKRMGDDEYVHRDSMSLMQFMKQLIASPNGTVKIWFLSHSRDIDERFSIMRRVSRNPLKILKKLIEAHEMIFKSQTGDSKALVATTE